MKKLIVLFAILSVGFVSCTKDSTSCAGQPKNLALENATVIAGGELNFPSKTNSGFTKLYLQTNGKYVLGLEKMNLNVGASMLVYLSPSKTVSPQALKIFSVNNVVGDIFHVLPAGVDVALLKYLIIQTELSDEIIATAELN